jgi:hypothetical protein
MDRRHEKPLKIRNTAKLALAVMLLVGFLSSIVPLARVSAGSTCTLECCAGRAPHAAGSCMDGACEASLLTHPKAAGIHQAKLDRAEQLCGLSHAVVVKSLAQMPAKHAPPQVRSDQTTASASAAFVKPCQPDCGACASGFTNPNRQKNSAAMADAVRPRGPTGIHLSNHGYGRTHDLDALCRQCGPRGPPFSFS